MRRRFSIGLPASIAFSIRLASRSRLALSAVSAIFASFVSMTGERVARADGFVLIHADYARPDVGSGYTKDSFTLGLRFMSAWDSDFQVSFGCAFRYLDLSSFSLANSSDALVVDLPNIGVHYFPRNPFWLGPTAARPLIGVEGGFAFNNRGIDWPLLLLAGLAFSGEEPAGMFVEAFWRATPEDIVYGNATDSGTSSIHLPPYFGARAGVFF